MEVTCTTEIKNWDPGKEERAYDAWLLDTVRAAGNCIRRTLRAAVSHPIEVYDRVIRRGNLTTSSADLMSGRVLIRSADGSPPFRDTGQLYDQIGMAWGKSRKSGSFTEIFGDAHGLEDGNNKNRVKRPFAMPIADMNEKEILDIASGAMAPPQYLRYPTPQPNQTKSVNEGGAIIKVRRIGRIKRAKRTATGYDYSGRIPGAFKGKKMIQDIRRKALLGKLRKQLSTAKRKGRTTLAANIQNRIAKAKSGAHISTSRGRSFIRGGG